jgi:hypothetical protein
MSKVIGNHGSYRKGPQIAGPSNKVIPFGWVQVSGKAGEEVFLEAAGIPIRYGALNMGAYFQSSGNVTASFTLDHPEYAADATPEIQAGVQWSNQKNLSSTIEGVNFPFTVVRLHFNADAIVHVAAF